MKRVLLWWLVVALVVAGLPVLARAGSTVDDANAAYVETDSSGGDDDSSLNKEFALGLLVVIVAVLLWVGFREDIGLWSWNYEEAPVQVCEASRVSVQAVSVPTGCESAAAGLAVSVEF